MTKKVTQYSVILFLVLLFAAPGVLAYLFYQHPHWLGVSHINKGTLLEPPVLLDVFDEKPQWRLMLWSAEGCDKACLQQVEQLAKLRLALGRKLYGVDQWLLIGDKAPPLTHEVQALLQESDIHYATLSHEITSQLQSLSATPVVYIVNPQRYLILQYTLESSRHDIYKDLNLLLNNSTQQSSYHAK
jgi:hypothetical protein